MVDRDGGPGHRARAHGNGSSHAHPGADGDGAADGPAAAADLSVWTGRWAPSDQPEICANEVGDPTDMLPITIDLAGPEPGIEGYESSCTAVSVTPVEGVDAVSLHLSCSGEGETVTTLAILMLNDPDTITIYESQRPQGGEGGHTMQRTRCR